MPVLCGTDIIEIKRIEESLDTEKNGFRDRVFTEIEIAYCENKGRSKFQSYAVRFAAKEAVVKAFGTGIGKGINFNDIEVINDSNGKPEIVLKGKAKDIFVEINGIYISVSLAHCKEYGVAFVTLETK